MEREKPSKPNKRSGSKLLKLLPRAAASGVSFQNPPFSPGRSSESSNIKRNLTRTSSSLDPNSNHHRTKSQVGKGHSGPLMVSIIPTEARRRPKSGEAGALDTPEPVSPKVSCMGQIKHRKMKKKSKADVDGPEKKLPPPPKKQASAIRRIFGGGKQRSAGEKTDGGGGSDAAPELARLPDGAPALGQMRRFTSGREALAGFDWSEVQVAPVDSEQRNYHSDEERDHREAREGGEEEEEEEDEEVMIPFSAPILVGAGGGGGGGRTGSGVKDLQPRKEINLWKRRTMAPPRPLRLHPSNGKN